MFSGIIEEIGRVKEVSKKARFWQVGIDSKVVSNQVNPSGSVSVNGVCLTVTRKQGNLLYFEVVPATLKISNLGFLKVGDYVNLESSLSLGAKLEGHFVLGHIDTMGKIRRFTKTKDTGILEIEIPSGFKKYLIPRGSVAVEGISLSIAQIKSNSFLLNIIPHTLLNTNLKYKRAGAYLNIEFDYLVKIVFKAVEGRRFFGSWPNLV